MVSRPPISSEQIDNAVIELANQLKRRIAQHGSGIHASAHEILGVVTEEYKELVDAVQANTPDAIGNELMDIAVGCVFVYACIQAGWMEVR